MSAPPSRLPGLLGLLAVQRLAAILLLRPGGYLFDYSDYATYWLYARFLAEDFWPFRDFWLEYPPLFPLLNQAIYALSLHFPPLADGRFWHHLLLALSLLPFDLAVAVLLHRLAVRLWGAARGDWTLALWTLLFAPLYLWQGNFEVLPLFGLLLTLWAMAARRPVLAGVGLALGFVAKLISVLALPAALWVFAHPARRGMGLATPANGRMLGSFFALTLLVIGPTLLVGPEWLATFARSVASRGAWQTAWALVDGNFGFGIVYGDRFSTDPDFAVTRTQIPWPLIHGLFATIGLWLWSRRWRWDRPAVQLAFVATTLFLFHLWSKGWSPQFTLILLPFILLLLPNAWGAALSLLLTALMVWEFGYFAAAPPDARWMLVTIVAARTIVLVALAIVSVARLRDWSRPEWVGVEEGGLGGY